MSTDEATLYKHPWTQWTVFVGKVEAGSCRRKDQGKHGPSQACFQQAEKGAGNIQKAEITRTGNAPKDSRAQCVAQGILGTGNYAGDRQEMGFAPNSLKDLGHLFSLYSLLCFYLRKCMHPLTSPALTEPVLQGGADRRRLTLGRRDLWDLPLCPSPARPSPCCQWWPHCLGFSKPCDHFLDSRAWLFRAPPPPSTFWNFKPQKAEVCVGGKKCRSPFPCCPVPS